jgi:hypothetical protein
MGKVSYVPVKKSVVVPGVGKTDVTFYVYKDGDDSLSGTNLKFDGSDLVMVMNDSGDTLFSGECETCEDGCVLVTIDKTSEVTPFAALRHLLFDVVWKDTWKPEEITDLTPFFECIIPKLRPHLPEFPMMHTGDSNTLYGPHSEIFQNIVTVLMFRAAVSMCASYADFDKDTMLKALTAPHTNMFQSSHETVAPFFLTELKQKLAAYPPAEIVSKVGIFIQCIYELFKKKQINARWGVYSRFLLFKNPRSMLDGVCIHDFFYLKTPDQGYMG